MGYDKKRAIELEEKMFALGEQDEKVLTEIDKLKLQHKKIGAEWRDTFKELRKESKKHPVYRIFKVLFALLAIATIAPTVAEVLKERKEDSLREDIKHYSDTLITEEISRLQSQGVATLSKEDGLYYDFLIAERDFRKSGLNEEQWDQAVEQNTI